MSRAIVIGGGVGGLTAGLALRERGWDVTVVERAPALEAVGSGLAVAVNALRALDTLGLGDQVRELSRVQGAAGIQSASGRWLSRTSPEAAHARYGDSIVLMLRRTLVDLLAGRLGGDQVRLGAEVTGLDAERGLVRLGEETLEADLVVAADGIHSRTRKQLFPGLPGPVYAGVTAWRALLPRPEGLTIHSVELGQGQGVRHPPARRRPRLPLRHRPGRAGRGAARRARGPAAPLRRLGGADPALLSGRPGSRPAQRRLLPGQAAARAAQGQGGADRRRGPPDDAQPGPGRLPGDRGRGGARRGRGGDLAAYTGARLRRTADIVRKSAAICRVTKLRAPLAVRLRDTGMKLAGKLSPDLVLRSMDGVLDWRPPAWSGRGPDARV